MNVCYTMEYLKNIANVQSTPEALKDIQIVPQNVSIAIPTFQRSTRLKALLPHVCLLYTSPSPRDATLSRMPSSA